MAQITTSVARDAGGARAAAASASGAKADAEHSGEVMREAISAMSAIERGSAEIGHIIGVIDEIAFQTNLLALNAGVEAARAGDVGRGFAVVAQEVRALAQRSAQAAKEIKALVGASSASVDEGVRLVGDTGAVLGAIVGRVGEIDGQISDFARTAQEQSTGLAQINAAVGQMDLATQRNAAIVEETSAAAQGLKTEALELARRIATFKVNPAAADSEGRFAA